MVVGVEIGTAVVRSVVVEGSAFELRDVKNALARPAPAAALATPTKARVFNGMLLTGSLMLRLASL